MGTWIIIGIVIVFGLWLFVPLYKENGKRGNEDEYTDDKLRHIADSAYEKENLKKLKEKLDHMDYLYESAQVNRESERTLENIRFHRADVRDAYEDVLETKWEEKMLPIIEDLDNYISMALEDGQHGFMDIDDVIVARDKALRLYDKYWKTGSAFNEEHKYDAGLYSEGDTNMIVSRGIGNSIIPFRFNNRPEIVLIELKSQS